MGAFLLPQKFAVFGALLYLIIDCSFRYSSGVICGATLIASQYAITAAHCFFETNDYNGGYDQSSYKEDYYVVAGAYSKDSIKYKRNIKRIFTPFEGKKWYPRFHSDLVVLELDEPFPYKQGKIKPACLPTLPVEFGSRCYTSGWGSSSCYRCPGTEELNAIKMDILECPRHNITRGIAIAHR